MNKTKLSIIIAMILLVGALFVQAQLSSNLTTKARIENELARIGITSNILNMAMLPTYQQFKVIKGIVINNTKEINNTNPYINNITFTYDKNKVKEVIRIGN